MREITKYALSTTSGGQKIHAVKTVGSLQRDLYTGGNNSCDTAAALRSMAFDLLSSAYFFDHNKESETVFKDIKEQVRKMFYENRNYVEDLDKAV